MSNVIYDYFIRTILVSMLEQGFISLMAIILLNAFDELKKNKVKNILIFISPAFISNLPRIMNIPEDFGMILGTVATLSVLYIVTKKNIFHCFLCCLGSTFIFALSELIFVNLVMYSANLTLNQISSNVFITFLVSILERVFQYALLYFFLFKWKFNTNFISIVNVSRTNRISTIIVLVLCTGYVLFFAKVLAIDGLLHGRDSIYSITICVLIYSAPISMAVFWYKTLCKNSTDTQTYIDISSTEIGKATNEILRCAILSQDIKTIEAAQRVMKCLDDYSKNKK